MTPHRKRQIAFTVGYTSLAIAALLVLRSMTVESPPREVSYGEFLRLMEQGKVERLQLRPQDIDARLKLPEGGSIHASRLPNVDETTVVMEARKAGVDLVGKIEPTPWWQTVLGWIIPIGLMVAFYWFGVRRVSRNMGPLSVAGRGKIHDASAQDRVTFDDVAGVDEAKAELLEVVDFLKNPDKYKALGARIPKGVLLVGPPGTGKTLLARAVAGQASVPFFSISGSEFVEMFVGVGAARVRDLFEQAKEKAPCIVFIDELDAIGKTRAGATGFVGGHDEREQTLNQILTEMDGFDPSTGVIVLAATDRKSVV